jgi:hypothetical protein
MLSPLVVQRIGMPFTLAGLLAIAAVGFGVQALVGGPQAAFTIALGWALWAFGGSAAATITTGTIIGSAPPERAGAVSALAQTGAELGGALGIAVLGSLGTAIYRGMVASSLPEGISPELAAAARDTLGGALSVASQIPDSAAATTLVLTAQDALTTAVQVTSAIGAIISILMAVAVAICLRARRHECQASSSAHACELERAPAAQEGDRNPQNDSESHGRPPKSVTRSSAAMGFGRQGFSAQLPAAATRTTPAEPYARSAAIVATQACDICDRDRTSDSPFVETVWRTRSDSAGSFISTATVQWEMVVTQRQDRTFITVRGPQTSATPMEFPADVEWFGITFQLGTFMPQLPPGRLMDGRDANLPEATGRSFWLHGSAWQFPSYDNADEFVRRLESEGLLARDPVVHAARQSRRECGSESSVRSVQHHFVQATGLTRSMVRQIERARAAAALLERGVPVLDTVHEAAYFDQPHMTRSLKRFLGKTPAQIARGE